MSVRWRKVEPDYYQRTVKGSTRGHEYYFITKTGGEIIAGYFAYGRVIVARSWGTFDSFSQAREQIKKYDQELTILTAQLSS